MWSRIWKVGMMTAALSGLLILPACEEDLETEPINTNEVDIEPVEPRDTDIDLDVRTTPPSTTPQDLPDIQIEQQQTTPPDQQTTQPLEPLPQPQDPEQNQQNPNSQVEPLPQPGSAP